MVCSYIIQGDNTHHNSCCHLSPTNLSKAMARGLDRSVPVTSLRLAGMVFYLLMTAAAFISELLLLKLIWTEVKAMLFEHVMKMKRLHNCHQDTKLPLMSPMSFAISFFDLDIITGETILIGFFYHWSISTFVRFLIITHYIIFISISHYDLLFLAYNEQFYR